SDTELIAQLRSKRSEDPSTVLCAVPLDVVRLTQFVECRGEVDLDGGDHYAGRGVVLARECRDVFERPALAGVVRSDKDRQPARMQGATVVEIEITQTVLITTLRHLDSLLRKQRRSREIVSEHADRYVGQAPWPLSWEMVVKNKRAPATHRGSCHFLRA